MSKPPDRDASRQNEVEFPFNSYGATVSEPLRIYVENAVVSLFEDLRRSGWLFEHPEHGGQQEGARIACHAVSNFIYKLGGSPEMTSAFRWIMEGFKDLQRGVVPTIFTLTRDASERDRSSARKWNQKWAAAILHFLMSQGEKRKGAAQRVARAVNGWPWFKSQNVSANTIIAWRTTYLGEESNDFLGLCQALEEDPGNRQHIAEVLRNGPPEMAASQKSPSNI